MDPPTGWSECLREKGGRGTCKRESEPRPPLPAPLSPGTYCGLHRTSVRLASASSPIQAVETGGGVTHRTYQARITGFLQEVVLAPAFPCSAASPDVPVRDQCSHPHQAPTHGPLLCSRPSPYPSGDTRVVVHVVGPSVRSLPLFPAVRQVHILGRKSHIILHISCHYCTCMYPLHLLYQKRPIVKHLLLNSFIDMTIFFGRAACLAEATHVRMPGCTYVRMVLVLCVALHTCTSI